MRGDRDHLRRRSVRGRSGAVGHRAHRPAGLPLPSPRAGGRDGCGRDDRLPDRGAGRFHGGGPQCLHRWADRNRQTQGPGHPDGGRLVADRRIRVRRGDGRDVGRHGPTAASDFQGHDRKRGRYRRHLGPDAHAGGSRRRQAVFRRGTAVLAVGAAGLFQHWDHDRVADWVVGVVAPAGADARNPRCTQT